jgi:hypothetical protein
MVTVSVKWYKNTKKHLEVNFVERFSYSSLNKQGLIKLYFFLKRKKSKKNEKSRKKKQIQGQNFERKM